jgi:hypothetical protein
MSRGLCLCDIVGMLWAMLGLCWRLRVRAIQLLAGSVSAKSKLAGLGMEQCKE